MLNRLILIPISILLAASIAGAQSVPTVVNYQGRLLENAPGQSPIDSTVSMDFTLFGSPMGNDNLWSESWPTVAVTGGIFNVLLGNNGSPIPSSLFTPGTDLYLEITIDGETLAPRQRFGSVAWAFHSEKASNLSIQCVDGQVLVFGSGTWACSDLPCPSGFDDCDAIGANGCETSLSTLSDCGVCGQPCALSQASESCSTGTCLITACDPGWDNCDGVDATGCETSIETLTDCGACGIPCDLANAGETCVSGTCMLTGCDAGYSDCDANTGNGCELDHAFVSGSCGGGINAGTYDGDTLCGFICASNTAWDTFGTFTGTTSRWFSGTVREDSNCAAPIEHRIRLTVPAGIDFDLYAYTDAGCSTVVASSTNLGHGISEELILWAPSTASDDSFTYYIEVRYVSGQSCTSYTIRFDGHNC